MRYFRLAFLVLFFAALAGVMAGAHHQFAIMIMCVIAYSVLTPKTKPNERAND